MIDVSFLHGVNSVREWDDYVNLMVTLRERRRRNEYIRYT